MKLLIVVVLLIVLLGLLQRYFSWGLSHVNVITSSLGLSSFEDSHGGYLVKKREEMKIVGACLSRTGTVSLQTALQRLGYKVYHGVNTFGDPDASLWAAVGRAEMAGDVSAFEEASGKLIDYLAIQGYNATTDCPACAFYPELMEKYPNSKVILCTRDSAEAWVESYLTISSKVGYFFKQEPFSFSSTIKSMMEFGDWMILTRWKVPVSEYVQAGDPLFSREVGIKAYNDYISTVKQTVKPSDRLLVFNSKDGWAPLCQFLNINVDECPKSDIEPFPFVNDKKSIMQILFLFQCVIYLYSHRYLIIFTLFNLFFFTLLFYHYKSSNNQNNKKKE